MKKMKKEKVKSLLNVSAYIITGINLGIFFGALSTGANPIKMCKSFTRTRLVSEYSVTESENGINCDKTNGVFSVAPLMTVYNSYIPDGDLLAIYKSYDGTIDDHEMHDYLEKEYDENDYKVTPISSDHSVVYGVYTKK